jgi:N-acetylglutamate synthase
MSGSEPGRSTTPGLGPHCVGQRVVVRRMLRGEHGPTGGPAFTDLLGVMERWSGGTTSVRAEDGTLTEIALADIVSGKSVPPRPSVRNRVTAEEAERRAARSWPAVETAYVGDWLLRASSGFSRRANSALLVGDPGRPVEEALGEVVHFYTGRALPVLVQSIAGSKTDAALRGRGWAPARPDEADVSFLLGGVASAARAVRRMAAEVGQVEVGAGLPDGWLATDDRAAAAPDAARAVLTGPESVGFAEVLVDGSVVARGRAALGDEPDPWVGITDLWVAPGWRRKGLGTAVSGALLGWAAERGATTVHLQVLSDDTAARGLYERLGLSEHHRYRYLTNP